METQTKSYFSGAIVVFLIVTYFYYNIAYLKQSYYDTEGKLNEAKPYQVGIYFAILIILQICISWTIVASNTKCKIVKNNGKILGQIFVSTFCPWFFIFGLAILSVTLYPKFKAVFSNTFGYMIVNNTAGKLLIDLLKVPSTLTTDPAEIKLADTINKIYGNTSILINAITPENFSDYITNMKPLMKIDSYNDVSEFFKIDKDKGKQLFAQVEKRDNIGEFFWYLYNALFVISIVTYNISLISCK